MTLIKVNFLGRAFFTINPSGARGARLSSERKQTCICIIKCNYIAKLARRSHKYYSRPSLPYEQIKFNWLDLLQRTFLLAPTIPFTKSSPKSFVPLVPRFYHCYTLIGLSNYHPFYCQQFKTMILNKYDFVIFDSFLSKVNNQ